MARILIVDDSATARGAVRDALEGCGHDLIEFEDGVEALEAAPRLRPHLAIVDVVMAFSNGFGICRNLRQAEATRATRVVLLTAKSGEADARWGYAQGADAYIAKPFDPGGLRAVVDSLLTEVPP